MAFNQWNRQKGLGAADKYWQDRQNLCRWTAIQPACGMGMTSKVFLKSSNYNWISKTRPFGHDWHARCYIPPQRINVHEGGGTAEEGIPHSERNFINP
jgi:hypothetical protein